MTSSPLQQTIKRVLCQQPLTFLDPVFYTNPELANLEQQNIFSKTWLYVGHTDKLPAPGSILSVEVAGRSIIIMRSLEGALGAFYNACSHRGSQLYSSETKTDKEASQHTIKCIVCPYHGWTFGADGTLKGLPEKDRFTNKLDFDRLSLKSVRLETWGPLIFISLSKSAPPLKNFLGEMVERMSGFPIGSLTLLFEKDYDIACNWKTFHDNGLCDYHVNIAHQTTLKDVQGLTKYYQYVYDDYVNALITPITQSWQTENTIWSELSEPLRSQFVTFGIFPNLHIYALPDGTLYIERIDAISHDKCRVHSEVYGRESHLDHVDELKDWYDELFEEDRILAEGVQQGYISIQGESGEPHYAPGPINQLEARIVHQQQLIRRFLLTGLSKEIASPIGSSYSDRFRNSETFRAVISRTQQ